MATKPPKKPVHPIKVNFLSEQGEGILEIPIFVTRAKKQPQKKPVIKNKKESNDS